MKKDILTLLDLDKSDFERLINRAIELKRDRQKGIVDRPLVGKTLGLLFDKASTRTRLSLEAAIIQLGGTSIYIGSQTTQLSRSEPIRDTARVMSRYIDALAVRTYAQERVEEFAKWSTIPVLNALTDSYHPLQVLSDLMTVVEKKGTWEGLQIAWIGDGNNVAHSWIHAAAVLGLNLVLACPAGYLPNPDILGQALKLKRGKIRVTQDPKEAASGADVINTDVWASMGQEQELSARIEKFKPYQVNSELMKFAAPTAMVMHCLPAHRGEEITDEVMEGFHSVIWDQAENKMHLHKAVLEALIAHQ
jgi:ornithine carbamoyltransferase